VSNEIKYWKQLIRTWRLHPLIHTFLEFNLARDIENKKAEPKTPHFLSLNQDIVVRSQGQKCGLKYVIHSPRKGVREFRYER
jgi:hypothetical protein